MAKFMLVLGGTDVDKRGANMHPELVERYMAWLGGLRSSGKVVGSFKLHVQAGRRLTVRGGEVMDGPFIETKEAIGGAIVIEARSLDEATAIARACPVFEQNGYVEVRAVEMCNGERQDLRSLEAAHEGA